MGVYRSGFQSVANAIWSLVAVALKTVNVTNWNGSAPNNLNSGRVDAFIDVTQKTGYALTPGSYSVRASSSQSITGSMSGTGTNQSLAISIAAVTTTRAHGIFGGNSHSSNDPSNQMFARGRITSSTVYTIARFNGFSGDTTTVDAHVEERV